jgi:hypothetical protein
MPGGARFFVLISYWSDEPKKDLGARKPQKRGVTVAKKRSWSPQTPKKRCNGRQKKILEPANLKKEV